MTDKYENGYVPTYLRLAAEFETPAHICEVGVRDGSSLELWQHLTGLSDRGAVVVGVDNDPNSVWPTGTERVISDQASRELRRLLEPWAPYDLIVDDASHIGRLTALTFGCLWPLVKPGRWYVVEDWTVGLPGQAPLYEPEMLNFASDLLTLLGTGQLGIEEIRYRDGLIVIRKSRDRINA